jgi:predicted deacetylase
VLHGLYHENRRGFDDFHTRTKAAAEEEIREGLEILQEIGIKSNVFIPPCWKLLDQDGKINNNIGWKPYLFLLEVL